MLVNLDYHTVNYLNHSIRRAMKASKITFNDMAVSARQSQDLAGVGGNLSHGF